MGIRAARSLRRGRADGVVYCSEDPADSSSTEALIYPNVTYPTHVYPYVRSQLPYRTMAAVKVLE